MHYSPVAIGWFARSTEADRTFVKQVGFADYYFGSRDVREKLGLIQSLPAPGEAMLAKNGLRWLPQGLRERVRRHMLPLVGIVEDLPDPQNRITLTNDGIRLSHSHNDYDRQRGLELTRRMKSILRGAGAIAAMGGMLPSQEHVAHQCGTLRFGDDPRQAVTDRNCRVFGTSNLFVADGSVLPTSLGVGPSLTIIANALRVARIVASEV
jgi:choline dehydrogenase-like flavoprotein